MLTPTRSVLIGAAHSRPGAAKEKDNDGNTPLHVALRPFTACPADLQLALLQAWPDAAKEKNAKGCTPLHLALGTTKLGKNKNTTSEAVVKAVYEAWPVQNAPPAFWFIFVPPILLTRGFID